MGILANVGPRVPMQLSGASTEAIFVGTIFSVFFPGFFLSPPIVINAVEMETTVAHELSIGGFAIRIGRDTQQVNAV